MCRPVFQILTRFQTKNCNFHARFQTRPLKSIPFSDLAFRQKLCYHYLNYSANKKNSSNPFRTRIFLFLSYLLGNETINTFIHSRSSPKTIPDSRPKWAKCIRPVSVQNGAKTLPDGAAHTYMAYLRECPPRDMEIEPFQLPHHCCGITTTSYPKLKFY